MGNIKETKRSSRTWQVSHWGTQQRRPELPTRTFFLVAYIPSISGTLENTWIGHVMLPASLSKTILHDVLEGGARHGQQRKYLMDNVKEWTSLPMSELFTMASCRRKKKKKKRLDEDLCWIVAHVCPTTQSVKGLNWAEISPDMQVIYTRHTSSIEGTFSNMDAPQWHIPLPFQVNSSIQVCKHTSEFFVFNPWQHLFALNTRSDYRSSVA